MNTAVDILEFTGGFDHTVTGLGGAEELLRLVRCLLCSPIFRRLNFTEKELLRALGDVLDGGRIAGDAENDLKKYRPSIPDDPDSIRAANRRRHQYIRKLLRRISGRRFAPKGGRLGTLDTGKKVRKHLIPALDDHVLARALLNRFGRTVWDQLSPVLVGGRPGVSVPAVVRTLAFALARTQRSDLILFDLREAFASARREDMFVGLAQHGVDPDAVDAVRALYAAVPETTFPGLAEGHPVAPLGLATILAPIAALIEPLVRLAYVYVDDGAAIVDVGARSDKVLRILREELFALTGLQAHDDGQSPKTVRRLRVDHNASPVHAPFTALGSTFTSAVPLPADSPVEYLRELKKKGVGFLEAVQVRLPQWLQTFDVGQPRQAWVEYTDRITNDFAAEEQRALVAAEIARFEEQRHQCREDTEETPKDTQSKGYTGTERHAKQHARRTTSPLPALPRARALRRTLATLNPAGGPSRPSGPEGPPAALFSTPLAFHEWLRNRLRLRPGELLSWIASSASCLLSWGNCHPWVETTTPWVNSGCSDADGFQTCWLGAEPGQLWRLRRVQHAVQDAYAEMRLTPEKFFDEREDPDHFGWRLSEELPVDFLIAASEIQSPRGQLRELLVHVTQLLALRRVPDEFGAEVMKSVVRVLRDPLAKTRFLSREGNTFTLKYTSAEGPEQIDFGMPSRSAESFPQWFEFHQRVWMGPVPGGTTP